MLNVRVIPCLLLRGRGLVKTVRFKDPRYLGDPINIVRLFNDKEVDELVLLDVEATPAGRGPPFEYLKDVTTECFVPLAYGGGVRSLDDVRRLVQLGIEKVVLNTAAFEDPELVTAAADAAGSSSVVVSIDVKRTLLGRYEARTHGGRKATGADPVAHAVEMERRGAGEILVNSIDRDGTMSGYDLDLVRRVSDAVRVPVVACGGARDVADLVRVVREGGASAAAAGSMFVFHGPHRAVLVSYPRRSELDAAFAGAA